MRHLGWLRAVPDPGFRKNKSGKPQPRPRLETLKPDSPAAQMPELEGGQHLLEWLHELGVTSSGMNGPIPLLWTEINAWKQATGTAATAEELVILRRMSSEYVSQFNASADPTLPPPNAPRNTDKDALAKNLKAGLRRAADNRKK